MDERIDVAARAIYKLRPAIQPWNGDPFEFDEPRARHERELAQKQAAAAIVALDRSNGN